MSKKPKAPSGAATTPAMNCAYAKLVDPNELQPRPDNPNKHPEPQLKLYAKILLHQGFRKPLVVSKQSGCIVTGHGAWLTAKAEGWRQVPVDYQDFKTPADEAAHMLADNRLPQLAELDEEQFAAVLREQNLNIELAGILQEEPQEKPELRKVSVKAPPKMAWVLIGIPLVRFSEINADVERIAKLPETVVHTTVNDQGKEDLLA